jgi:hypothetical protein
VTLGAAGPMVPAQDPETIREGPGSENVYGTPQLVTDTGRVFGTLL